MVMYRPLPRRRKKPSNRKYWLVALVVLLVAGSAWFFYFKDKDERGDKASSQSQSGDNETTEEIPKPKLVDLQPTVDAWVAGKSPTYGIVVYDPANQKTVASHNPDQKFFAASLYKIFVAYLSLVDFQNGAQDPNSILTGGFTRKECVDKMIRESNSACGEAMMASIGQATLKQRVSDMGIKNTIFGGEGLFYATLRGPGKVWVQTLPVSRLASPILQYGTVNRKDEGSILGGLGNMVDGDGW